MSRALTREEIAEALDEVSAEWETLYVHYKVDTTCLVVEIELSEES
jgi:hypothetical protein